MKLKGKAISDTPASSDTPKLRIESRPSDLSSSGLSWWVVLAYGDLELDELLPYDFMALPEERRLREAGRAVDKLTQRLKPVLIEEDRPKLSLVD